MLLKDVLKGYKLGQSQVVGNMRVVPILTDQEFTKVTGMENVSLKRDMSYERLLMENSGETIAVIPQGLMYVTSESAQDRAIGSAHMIKGKSDLQVDADCLQPSQGGYMAANNRDREYGVLPKSLRTIALEKEGDGEYSSLWGDMESFLKSVGLNGRELAQFFREYKDELETFVAQFEPVDKQVGALFIINNHLMGIEILPTYESWLQMWRPLVRDCYGAEAVAFNKKGYSRALYKPIIKADEVETLDDLEAQVNAVIDEEQDYVKDIFAEVKNIDLNSDTRQELDDFTLLNFTSQKLVGQGVQHGPEHFIYVSLMTNELPTKEREGKARKFDSRWNGGSPYSNDRMIE